jgi:hypothetical protein
MYSYSCRDPVYFPLGFQLNFLRFRNLLHLSQVIKLLELPIVFFVNDCRFEGCDLPGETRKRLTVLDTCNVFCYSVLVNSRAYTSTRSPDSLVMRTTGESLIPGDNNTWEFHFPNNDELTGEYDSQLHKHSTKSQIVSRIAYRDQEKLCDKENSKILATLSL